MLVGPARRIHNIRSRKVIGHFLSLKMDQTFMFESTLEKDWLLWLDYLRVVEAFRTQPHTYQYIDHEGRSYPYTPDTEVIVAGRPRPLCHEVKPSRVARTSKFQLKHRARRAALAAEGVDLKLVTEITIRREPHLTGLKLLRHFAGAKPLGMHGNEAIDAVLAQAGGALSLRRLAAEVRSEDILEQHLFREIYAGKLWLDLSRPVGLDSTVCKRGAGHAY